MELTWKSDTDDIKWDELSHLYKIAPLGTKTESYLKKVMGNSMYKCFAYHDNKLIGVGRALADGVDCSYLCDIAVHPDYQGKGIGKSIVNKLLALSKGHKKILLYANPGKEGFYEKAGFKLMTTAMAIFKDQDAAIQSGLVRQK